MRIAEINMVSNGSTGKIMFQIAGFARCRGMKLKTYSTIPYTQGLKDDKLNCENHYVFGSRLENKLHTYFGILLGLNGYFSHFGTIQLINDLKSFNPDVVHLHNLHKFCINLPMLFKYLKSSGVKVIWTLHDCWSFTGHCAHFTMVKCDKWKTGCFKCPQLSAYPSSKIDNTKFMYHRKRKWFSGIDNMVLVTPSKWLASLVKESFLGEYPVKIINNGIDLSIFKPTPGRFRETYNLEDKFIVLGVAFDWGKRKGLDVFIELSKRLDGRFQIVLVGTNDCIDNQLPDNIISIHRTKDQKELAEIYSAADVFVNPTREDNFPTVNLEALACGTPVITFNTGGSPECIDENCGVVVGCDDINSLLGEIIRICETKPFSKNYILNRAKEFDMNERLKEYVKLYEDCSHSSKRAI